jgi:hypothetical protein
MKQNNQLKSLLEQKRSSQNSLLNEAELNEISRKDIVTGVTVAALSIMPYISKAQAQTPVKDPDKTEVVQPPTRTDKLRNFIMRAYSYYKDNQNVDITDWIKEKYPAKYEKWFKNTGQERYVVDDSHFLDPKKWMTLSDELKNALSMTLYNKGVADKFIRTEAPGEVVAIIKYDDKGYKITPVTSGDPFKMPKNTIGFIEEKTPFQKAFAAAMKKYKEAVKRGDKDADPYFEFNGKLYKLEYGGVDKPGYYRSVDIPATKDSMPSGHLNEKKRKKYSKSSTSLHNWFKKEDWVRINTSGEITGPCGTMKDKSKPSRCLPRAKANSLSKSERAATAKKKKEGGKKGKQFVSNTKKAKVRKEVVSPNDPVFNSFNQNDTLSKDIFDNSKVMHESIRTRLIEIANMFVKYLEIPLEIKDIRLTGSLANFNWSTYSDVDLHIIVDFDELSDKADLLKKFFDSKKSIWNDTYDIKIKGYDVELYVQDIDEVHTASGVYSVTDNKWIAEPSAEEISIDSKKVYDKTNEYSKRIDALEKSKDDPEVIISLIDSLKDKIKKFRKSGLEKGGEYSYENLVFKSLRRLGEIERLVKLKVDLTNKEYSINEKKDDRCTRIAKRKYEEWPSAYASGAVVRCRQGKIWKGEK